MIDLHKRLTDTCEGTCFNLYLYVETDRVILEIKLIISFVDSRFWMSFFFLRSRMKRESVKSHVKYEKVNDFMENFNSCKFLNVYQKACEHMTCHLTTFR